MTDNFWWGFDVAYESLSGDAIIVYNNGTTGTAGLSYRVWNGSAWTGPFTITTAGWRTETTATRRPSLYR